MNVQSTFTINKDNIFEDYVFVLCRTSDCCALTSQEKERGNAGDCVSCSPCHSVL